MKLLVYVLIAALIVLHQDVWFWEDDTLVLGFLPTGLAYHIGLSLAAVLTWLLAVKYAWPAANEMSNLDGPGDERMPKHD